MSNKFTLEQISSWTTDRIVLSRFWKNFFILLLLVYFNNHSSKFNYHFWQVNAMMKEAQFEKEKLDIYPTSITLFQSCMEATWIYKIWAVLISHLFFLWKTKNADTFKELKYFSRRKVLKFLVLSKKNTNLNSRCCIAYVTTI